MTQTAIDIANWQGDLGAEVYATWRDEGVRTVICGTSGNPSAPIVYEAQARKASVAGLNVEAYIWLNWLADADAFAARIRGKLELVRRVSAVRTVWLDCEDESFESGADVVGLIALARDIVRGDGLAVGIYTGRWWWDRYIASVGFHDLPLWLAHYDGSAELTSGLMPFGGWLELHRKQYTDKGKVGGVFPLDVNVERDTGVVQPPAVQPPAGELVDVMAAQVRAQGYAEGVRLGRIGAIEQVQLTLDRLLGE